MTPSGQFLSHLALVERLASAIARRHRCTPDDVEEFRAVVTTRLVRDDYAVFRKFEGKSSLATYLTAVIQRIFLDWRNQQWGKWRPSAEARRRGPAAVLLERMTLRDGHSVSEAVQRIRQQHGADACPEELVTILRMDKRAPRPRWVGEDQIPALAAPDSAEAVVMENDRVRSREAIGAAMADALARIPAEDRLIVQLRILEGLTVPQVALALRLEAKPLYRRLEAILKNLRDYLSAVGVQPEDVRELLTEDAVDPEVGRIHASRRELTASGPSLRREGSQDQ